MSRKRKKRGVAGAHAGDALHADLISANEYTGFVQHLPVSDEDIERLKRMYGGGIQADGDSEI